MANGFYEGQNLLYEKHDIQILKGIMTANSKGALAGEACGENNIEIDSVVYGCTDENANLYLGMYVNCYVHEGVVLCVLAPKKYNKVVVVDNEDI